MKIKALFILGICLPPLIFAELPEFYSNITNLWWRGHKSNVLAIAEQRLACNSNDIAGLILKMEYDIAFINLDTVSNSIQRVIDVGETITSPIYSKQYSFFRRCLEQQKEVFADRAMYVNLENERTKAFFVGKRILYGDDLLAVCLDGLVTNYPALLPTNSGTAQ